MTPLVAKLSQTLLKHPETSLPCGSSSLEALDYCLKKHTQREIHGVDSIYLDITQIRSTPVKA
jgi:hypothetical protein